MEVPSEYSGSDVAALPAGAREDWHPRARTHSVAAAASRVAFMEITPNLYYTSWT
ncbi:hypothetical protein GCM10020370_53570 [Paenibacillus hodogayensis]